MSEYYHHFLTSMSGVGDHPGQSPQDAHASAFPPPPMAMGGAPMAGSYQAGIGYFTGFPDPIMFNAPKAQRNRRKSAPGLDHVKHRRTRSGCFMCRSRRVKCDETRPTCERCRKGNRECIYPDPPAPKGSSGQSSSSKDHSPAAAQPTSPTSSGEEDYDDDQEGKLEPIPDEEEEPDYGSRAESTSSSMPRRTSTTSSSNLRSGTRHSSETPSQEGTKSSSPAASTTTTTSLNTATFQMAELSIPGSVGPTTRNDWAHLPSDIRFYLNYFVDNLTHYHYCLNHDYDDFFHSILPGIAIRNDALLYAVVGFAAYHATLQNPNGRLQDFLQYYNKSVTILLNSLKRKEKATVATLVTILQLATIEEYLGDWVNLMGHQKAALEIFTKLYTPQSAMQTATGRMIFWWYARYDVFIGIMGGFQTALARSWFTTSVEYCQAKAVEHPSELRWKYEENSAQLRLISMDMSILIHKENRGQITPELFSDEHQFIEKRLIDWRNNWDPALTNPSYFVTDFPNARPLSVDDIVDPFAPNVLYHEPLFPTTMLTAEWNSIMTMHKCQSSTTDRMQLFGDLARHAFGICQIFEAVENWPHSPKGCLIMIQACIAIGALFLPQDDRHRMWSRRKFALLETKGYIHPITLRSKMAALFEDPSCVRWWLPNDEGYSPILQSIRAFADERNALALTAQAESLRETRHIFSKLESSYLAEQTLAASEKGKDKAMTG